MPALRISGFGGIIPRVGDRSLPDNNAQFAINTKLLSGELRAWWNARHVYTFGHEVGELRISPDGTTTPDAEDLVDFALLAPEGFPVGFSAAADVVSGPLVNDQHYRHYYTIEGGRPGKFARDSDGNWSRSRLGVQTPVFTELEGTVVGGDDTTEETRVYTATLITKYGEESANGELVTVDGPTNGDWTITGLSTFQNSAELTGVELVTHLRVYRTITSGTGVDYRVVKEFPIGEVPYEWIDDVPATEVAAGTVLESTGWGPPPENLEGLTAIAGGYMAGFTGRTVHMSMPYYPHAWPPEFDLAVEDDIVALGSYGNTLVITTKGQPYVAYGTSPDSMSLSKVEAMLPCLSKRGLVATAASVLYPTPDGLASLSDGGLQIATKNYATKDEWKPRFTSSDMLAVAHDNRYLAFHNGALGYMIGFEDGANALTEISTDDAPLALHTDRLTGRTLYLVESDDAKKIYSWDGARGDAMQYTWRSKPFMVPKPINFAVLQLRGTFPVIDIDLDLEVPPPFGYGLGMGNIEQEIPPVEISGNLANGPVGEVVNSNVYTVTGGVGGGYSVVLLSGEFPAGLTLNADGSVTGTRTDSGVYEFEVGGVDLTGNESEPHPDTSETTPAWVQLAASTSWQDNPNGNCLAVSDAGLILLVALNERTYTTTDGVNWTENVVGDIPGSQTVLNNVRWCGDRFVIAGDTNNLPSSVDGVTWTPSNSISITTYAPEKRDVAYNGVRYVVVGNFRTWVSTDALTYSRDDDSPLPAEDAWSVILAVGALHVAFTFNSAVGATSTNGLDWVQHAIPAGADRWRDAKYANGIYMAIAANGKGATSLDGVNWTEINLPTGKSYRALAYGNGEWLAVGISGAASSTDNGQTWTVESALPDGAVGVVPHPDPTKRFLIALSDGGVAYWLQ